MITIKADPQMWDQVNIEVKNEQELLDAIAQSKVHCTYCSELATKINDQGMPICDIPGNH